MAITTVAEKDPQSVEPYYIVWASRTGLNDGTSADTGELQGATITTSDWAAPAGITIDSKNTAAITIAGVSYGVNTVATAWLSGGTDRENYAVVNTITTSDGRTLEKTILVPCRHQ